MAGKTRFNAAGGYSNAAPLSRYDYPSPKGDVLFVQSTHGSAGDTAGKGYSPDAPLATIDYAIGRCTADNDDVIVVMPGHVETVTTAAGVALDVAGVSIIGVGKGQKRPKINFTTAAGASFDISAAGCLVENIWFNCAIDDQTAMVNVTAADVVIRNCDFMLGDATYDAECGILASAAGDRLIVEGCHLRSTSTTAITTGGIVFGACDNAVVRDCIVTGYFATAGNIVNSAAAVGVIIDGNFLMNLTADGNNKTIVLHSSTSGLVTNNRSAIIDSSGPAPFTAAAAFVGGNYSASAVGVTAGTLI